MAIRAEQMDQKLLLQVHKFSPNCHDMCAAPPASQEQSPAISQQAPWLVVSGICQRPVGPSHHAKGPAHFLLGSPPAWLALAHLPAGTLLL